MEGSAENTRSFSITCGNCGKEVRMQNHWRMHLPKDYCVIDVRQGQSVDLIIELKCTCGNSISELMDE